MGFRIWLAPPLALLAVIFVYPLVLMGNEALRLSAGGWTLLHLQNTLQSSLFRDALLNTLQIALAATSLCLLLGLALALLLRFVPFPGSALLSRMIDSYLAYPSFLIALSLTFLYGNAGALSSLWHIAFPSSPNALSFMYGFWGVVLAEVTFYTPFVLRPLLAALETVDPAQIEVAASLGAKPLAVLVKIILPLLLPSLLAGGSLCLLLTINEIGIILVLGVKGVITLPMLIYNQAIQQFDYAQGSATALCDIALSLALYFLYRRLLGRAQR